MRKYHIACTALLGRHHARSLLLWPGSCPGQGTAAADAEANRARSDADQAKKAAEWVESLRPSTTRPSKHA